MVLDTRFSWEVNHVKADFSVKRMKMLIQFQDFTSVLQRFEKEHGGGFSAMAQRA